MACKDEILPASMDMSTVYTGNNDCDFIKVIMSNTDIHSPDAYNQGAPLNHLKTCEIISNDDGVFLNQAKKCAVMYNGDVSLNPVQMCEIGNNDGVSLNQARKRVVDTYAGASLNRAPRCDIECNDVSLSTPAARSDTAHNNYPASHCVKNVNYSNNVPIPVHNTVCTNTSTCDRPASQCVNNVNDSYSVPIPEHDTLCTDACDIQGKPSVITDARKYVDCYNVSKSNVIRHDNTVSSSNYHQLHSNGKIFSDTDYALSIINSNAFWDSYHITKSYGDGHCLIYSIVSSLKSQHDISLSPHLLLDSIKKECNDNKHRYLSLFENELHFYDEMNNYLVNKRYKLLFCDALPNIIANVVSLDIVIISDEDDWFTYCRIQQANEREISSKVVLVYKKGLHYDGLR